MIRLNKDGMPAALSGSSEDDGVTLPRNFNVFYKVVQAPDTQASYDIEIF